MRRGVTLVEVMVAMALMLIAFKLLWGGTRFLQNAMTQHARLKGIVELMALSQEISKQVREARRILSVGDDHLDLEIYDFSSYKLLDPDLVGKTKRVRYQYQNNNMAREVYASTGAAAPAQTRLFLKNTELIAPSSQTPLFYASYLVGQSTIGVKIEFGVKTPFSDRRWEPIKEEVYVKAAPF